MTARKPIEPGARFGAWVVQGPAPTRRGCTHVRVRCACGVEAVRESASLRAGRTSGCQRCAGAARRLAEPSESRPEYGVWVSMIQRCTNPRRAKFKEYGARGITVCDRWLKSFSNFLDDVGPRPSPSHSLDRFPNNDGHYEPGNVRWATAQQQALNQRRNVRITHAGESLTLSQWAKRIGVSQFTLYGRKRRGLSDEDVLFPGRHPTSSTQTRAK